MKQSRVGTAMLGTVLIVAPTIGQAQTLATEIGKSEYLNACAVCHGAGGEGDGPLAAQLKKTVPNLTTIQKNNFGVFPFAHVYDVIDGREAVAAHGPREMPVWGNAFAVEAGGRLGGFGTPKDLESFTRGQIVALIGYIYTLQAK